jgi:hypothetical protein
LELIVIPQELERLLHAIDASQARSLALHYAEQTLRDEPEALPAHLLETSLSYLAAARLSLQEHDTANLKAAHEQYFAARHAIDDLAESVSWIASIAVSAACQREMERTGILAAKSYVPSVLDVAREGQKIAGRRVQATGGDPAAVRAARWEQARKQLVLLVESVPFPG